MTLNKLQLAGVFPVVKAVRETVRALSVIRDFPMVADGRLDGQLIYGSGGASWDYAPRALLVREAGGRVANIGSNDYDMHNNDMLLANPVIFDELMQIIVAAQKS